MINNYKSPLKVCLRIAALFLAVSSLSAQAAVQTPATNQSTPAPKFPKYFDGGSILIVPSSHQDIAWMDSIDRCIAQRDHQVITPAMEIMGKDPGYHYSLENSLSVMEYLKRHPDRKAQLGELVRKGQMEIGATYNEPYESLNAGESLVRQTYWGRRWVKKTFPGGDALTAWSPDVPGRALQMPQILSKAGIKYLLISRHEKGFYRWLSPDGSGVDMYTPGLYVQPVNWLWNWQAPKDKPPGGGVETAFVSIAAEMKKQEANYSKFKLPLVFPIITTGDASTAWTYKYLKEFNALPTPAPKMKYATGTQLMDAIAEGKPDLPTITGERPNVWLYIHGPTHHWAISAMRDAARLLPAAEAFATIDGLLSGTLTKYPQSALDEAWLAQIYPDHGWGGNYGELTDETFKQKEEFARETGNRILAESTASIAKRVKVSRDKGEPVVVFNTLFWDRTDPVTVTGTSTRIMDSEGKEIPSQPVEGGKRLFIAKDVPALGYRTYYLVKDGANSAEKAVAMAELAKGHENEFFRIELTPGGIKSIFDKSLKKELLKTDKFLGGELFSMESAGNGAGEFAEVQKPNKEPQLMEFAKKHGPTWHKVESGPVFTMYEWSMKQSEQKFRRCSPSQRLIVYQDIKRLDLETSLMGWDGTPYREWRLAFPINIANGQVSYEVPMGVVEVGKSELPGAAGHMYKQACKEVHPREVQNWFSVNNSDFGVTISSSVAVFDYIDPTATPANRPVLHPQMKDGRLVITPVTGAPESYTVLQPLLLASRKSCNWKGNYYMQAGDHDYRFSIYPHAGGWQNGWRQGVQANTPLIAVNAKPASEASLPETLSFCSVTGDNLAITALKKAEDDNSVVLRCVDMVGRDSEPEFSLFKPVSKAERTNLIEEEGKPLPVSKGKVKATVGHHAIETLKMKLE